MAGEPLQDAKHRNGETPRFSGLSILGESEELSLAASEVALAVFLVGFSFYRAATARAGA